MHVLPRDHPLVLGAREAEAQTSAQEASDSDQGVAHMFLARFVWIYICMYIHTHANCKQ